MSTANRGASPLPRQINKAYITIISSIYLKLTPTVAVQLNF
jgi:hypothetical protein